MATELLGQCKAYIAEKRLLAARDRYQELLLYLDKSPDREKFEEEVLKHDKDMLTTMMTRANAVDEVIRSGSTEENDEWELGAELFGVVTKYKMAEDGLICVHIEGSQEDLPIFEQMTVYYTTHDPPYYQP